MVMKKNNLITLAKLIYWFLVFLAVSPEFLSDSALILLEEDPIVGVFSNGTEVGAIISSPTTFSKAFNLARTSPDKSDGSLMDTRRDEISRSFFRTWSRRRFLNQLLGETPSDAVTG